MRPPTRFRFSRPFPSFPGGTPPFALLVPFFLSVLFAGTVFFSCTGTESEDPRFNIKGDSSWLDLDSLVLLRADSLGEVQDTLFQGKLTSLEQLQGLPAGDFAGGKAQILVRGYKDGEEVLGVIGSFDGAKQLTEVEVEKDLQASPVGVEMSPDTLEMILGEEKEVTAKVLPIHVAQALSWMKIGNAIAIEVPAAGNGPKATLIAESVGQALLIARAEKDMALGDTLVVKVVYAPVASITLSPDSLVLKVGGQGDTLRALVKPATAYPRAVFSSTDSSVAAVDSNGYVFSEKVGEAWIIAEAGEKRDSTRVHVVRDRPPVLLALDKDTVVSIGDSVAFFASWRDEDGLITQIAWDFDGDGYFEDSSRHEEAGAEAHAHRRYDYPGDYSVLMRVTDNGGNQKTDSLKVKVDLDPPFADAGMDTTVLTGTAVHLHAGGRDGYGRIEQYAWKIGDAEEFIPLGKADTQVDTTITAPKTAGDMLCILRVTDDDGQIGLDTLVVKAVNETNAVLSSLQVSPGTLNPAFASETFSYAVHVGNATASIRVIPAAASERSTLRVNGNAPSGSPAGVTVALPAPGTHTVYVEVLAEDTTIRTRYTLVVTRAASAVKTLSALGIQSASPEAVLALTPAFSPSVANYTLTVIDTVDSLIVTPTKTQGEAAIKVNGSASGNGAWKVKIDTGVTNITIQVTAGDGSVGTYAVKVYRKAWILVGATPFISGAVSDINLDFYKGVPVVGHRTGSSFSAMVQLSGNNWINAGSSPISAGTVSTGSQFVSTPNYVYSVYRDLDQTANGKLRLRRWAGATTWSNYGLISDSSTYTPPSMASSADTVFIAYADNHPDNSRGLQVKRALPSGTVAKLGTTVSDSIAGTVALAVDTLGRPWVAYTDYYSTRNGRITLKYWNPTTLAWVLSSTAVSASTVTYLNLDIDKDTLYLAYCDAGNQSKLTVLRKPLTGGTWNNLGGAGFSEGTVSYVSMKVFNGEPYVAYVDYAAESGYRTMARVYRNGAWHYIGTPGFYGLTYYLSLTTDAAGKPYLALRSTGQVDGRLIRYYDPQAEGE